MADACNFLLKNYNEQGIVNIGCGTDVSIKELAELIATEVWYKGQLIFDLTKPDGKLRKIMYIKKINDLGWVYSIKLIEGVKKTISEVYNPF